MYIFATSFAGNFLLGFLNLGLDVAASVMLAKEPHRLGRVHATVVASCLLLGAFLQGLAIIAGPWLRNSVLPGIDETDLAFLLLALPFWVYQNACYGMLVGLGATKTRAGFDLAFNFLQNLIIVPILLTTIFTSDTERVRWLVGTFYGMIVATSVALPFILARRGNLLALPNWETVRDLYRYGFFVFVGNMGASVSQRLDQYVLKQAGKGDTAFGVYTLATSLTNRTRIFPQALSRSTYARICSAPKNEAAHLTAACFRQMMAMGIVLAIGGAIVSPLIPIIYSREFMGAIAPFLIFLIGRLFHNCSWMLANFLTGHLARPALPMAVNWLLLPIQGVASWFAMQHGGLVAIAAVTSAIYALNMVSMMWLFLRHQDAVTMGELFRLGARDFAPWKAIVRRIFGMK